MAIIDFHNHFYPPEYLKELEAGPSNIKVTFDQDNNPLLHYPGDYNIVVPGHRDVDFRADVLKKAGIQKQVLALTTPGTHVETPERAAELSRVYEKASELKLILDIHPTFTVGVEAMSEYWLMPLLGFTFDTTLTAAKLVFSGVAERFPGIKWILNHAGGAIPYLAERLDRGYDAFRECRENISQPPSECLKAFYYDSVNFDPKALRLAVEFAGPDHVLAGNEDPHQIGSLAKMVQTIEKLDISAEDKDKIMGGNAQKLLGLS